MNAKLFNVRNFQDRSMTWLMVFYNHARCTATRSSTAYRTVENHWVGENTCSIDRYDRSLRELHLSWTTSRGSRVAQPSKIRIFIEKHLYRT